MNISRKFGDGNFGPVRQSPDALMDVHIERLLFKLAERLKRLQMLHKIEAPDSFIQREKVLVRIAEIAVRARVRELALFVHKLSFRHKA